MRKKFLVCDLDNDEDIDMEDITMMKELIGICKGKDKYIKAIDYDKDGCISEGNIVTFMSYCDVIIISPRPVNQ